MGSGESDVSRIKFECGNCEHLPHFNKCAHCNCNIEEETLSLKQRIKRLEARVSSLENKLAN